MTATVKCTKLVVSRLRARNELLQALRVATHCQCLRKQCPISDTLSGQDWLHTCRDFSFQSSDGVRLPCRLLSNAVNSCMLRYCMHPHAPTTLRGNALRQVLHHVRRRVDAGVNIMTVSRNTRNA